MRSRFRFGISGKAARGGGRLNSGREGLAAESKERACLGGASGEEDGRRSWNRKGLSGSAPGTLRPARFVSGPHNFDYQPTGLPAAAGPTKRKFGPIVLLKSGGDLPATIRA
jgi:hypothetical protein